MKSRFIAGLALCLLFLAACAPRAIIVDPITPAVTKARASVEATATSSAHLEQHVQTIHTDVSALAVDIDKATSEADRLRKAGTATSTELEDQWKTLTGIKNRNLFLEAETEAAVKNADEQRFFREAANERMAELEKTATTTDKSFEVIKTQVVNQAGDAALGRSTKWLVIAVIILALIGLLIWGASRLRLL